MYGTVGNSPLEFLRYLTPSKICPWTCELNWIELNWIESNPSHQGPTLIDSFFESDCTMMVVQVNPIRKNQTVSVRCHRRVRAAVKVCVQVPCLPIDRHRSHRKTAKYIVRVWVQVACLPLQLTISGGVICELGWIYGPSTLPSDSPTLTPSVKISEWSSMRPSASPSDISSTAP